MQTVIPKPKSFSRSDETLSRKEPSFFCTGAERHFIIAEKEIYSESEPKNDMIYLPLSAAMLFNLPQGFISKQCNVKTEKPSAYIYAAVVATAAVLFFTLQSIGKFEFAAGVLFIPLHFPFPIYATVGNVQAIGCGPLSISSLIYQFSLILPTMYGTVFLLGII